MVSLIQSRPICTILQWRIKKLHGNSNPGLDPGRIPDSFLVVFAARLTNGYRFSESTRVVLPKTGLLKNIDES
ncbi:unnamed protein product [Danaus chrysippus]|uniref:(African queen) hypothetical protein n=1 Tax=Danaus chrysippus TaxID=151541 RepID=A0A8J2R5T2_9NEOP|nr:unnamed protein product [Danaus chrysippus]